MAESAIISAARWIGVRLANEINFLLGVEEQFRLLQEELNHMQQLLTDVDSAVEVGAGQLAIFIGTIRNIAFRAEDAIDTYVLEVASRNAKHGSFPRGSVRFFPKVFHIHNEGKEIQAIVTDLQRAFSQLQQYQVPRPIASEGPSDDNNRQRQGQNKVLTYPHTDDWYAVGRESEIEELVGVVTSMRCSEQTSSKEARVAAIVGPGGVGKTTLARKIYNHNRVTRHFKVAVWVTISRQWRKRDLLVEIISQIGTLNRGKMKSPKEHWTERTLVQDIHRFLSKNLHLIVLDDMWTQEAWNDVCDALPLNAGSKVIFTTRNNDLPSHVDLNCFVHETQLLKEEQSLELFKKIAFEDEDEDIRATTDDFSRLGTEMIRKCDGLPLAILILAGTLRTKRTLNEWQHVNSRFSSLLRQIEGTTNYPRSIYQALALSYLDLPHYLKPCFLYLAQFPENYRIRSKRLIQMWVSEGFVTANGDLLEDEGSRYLDELISRCMVQVVERSHFGTMASKSIRLHDVMREFCIAKANDECFLQVLPPTDRSMGTSSASSQSRRVSLVPCRNFLLTQRSHIRSFIQFGVRGSTTVSLDIRRTYYKLLRVLILHKVKTHDGYLPKQLGNLRLLRHLALINSNIKTLPESIGNLSNLLYLEYTVEAGTNREKLPNVLWKMEQFRHLYLDKSTVMPAEGLKLHTLANLQTLWTISVSGWKSEAGLEKLSQSLQKLGIVGIKSLILLNAALQSPCMKSGNLVNLMLQWSDGVKLRSMEPLYALNSSLRKLKLEGKIEEDYPLQFPPSLIKLELLRSKLELRDPIEAAGRLSSLKYLSLQFNAYRGEQITCNADSFPQLEELRLSHLYKLKEWRVEVGAMPQLKKLYIFECTGLERLPPELESVRSLQELEIWNMPRSFCHKLFRKGEETDYEYQAKAPWKHRLPGIGEEASSKGVQGEDFHIIQHISHVLFLRNDNYKDNEAGF